MAKELLIEYVMKSPLFKHRSIRKFKNRPIPDDTLREILEAARVDGAGELRTFITEQLALRSPHYEKARHIVDINVLDTFEKINEIVNIIARTLQDRPACAEGRAEE